jgi:hypothetical protein
LQEESETFFRQQLLVMKGIETREEGEGANAIVCLVHRVPFLSLCLLSLSIKTASHILCFIARVIFRKLKIVINKADVLTHTHYSVGSYLSPISGSDRLT